MPWIVDGQCPCEAPSQPCLHRIGRALLKRTSQLMAEQHQPPVALVPGGDEPSEPLVDPQAASIPAEFLTTIKGKPFVLYHGLRYLAGERGLVSITVAVISVSAELAVCQATAKFQDGHTWTEVGDATPQNCTKQVAAAFIRMAATRAKVRVLREALGIGICSVEEL